MARPFGAVEADKGLYDLYAPCDRVVVRANPELDESPSLVNTDCYASGWLLEIDPPLPPRRHGVLRAGPPLSHADGSTAGGLAVILRSPLLVTDTWLTDAPDRTVVHGALTLTLYLDDPRRWALELIPRLFDTFVHRINPSWLQWYRTSQESKWRLIEDLAEIREAIVAGQLTGRVRHLLEVRVADSPHAPRVGFLYREVDARHTSAVAYAQLVLPLDMDPNELLALAIEVGQEFPIVSGIGGYGFTWNPELPRNAFRAIHNYCKRYRGMDVQTPEPTAWLARTGLPGTNWLTLLGPGLLAGETLDVPEAAEWAGDVAILALAHATLVRAGERPVTGDVNMMEHPATLSGVARWLAPFVLRNPPPFPGTFSENEDELDATADWMHRFETPELW
ncbi:MAG: DUF3396 domain-containing protein [Polyangiaceae bacterium]|nr:DUF3396 domain-containing protein [Polyangiaceae bacterium]